MQKGRGKGEREKVDAEGKGERKEGRTKREGGRGKGREKHLPNNLSFSTTCSAKSYSQLNSIHVLIAPNTLMRTEEERGRRERGKRGAGKEREEEERR